MKLQAGKTVNIIAEFCVKASLEINKLKSLSPIIKKFRKPVTKFEVRKWGVRTKAGGAR